MVEKSSSLCHRDLDLIGLVNMQLLSEWESRLNIFKVIRSKATLQWDTLLVCSMVCDRSWHLPGNPRLAWHPARLVKEGRCADLSKRSSLDLKALLCSKRSLVLFGSEGSAITLPLILLLSRIIMLCNYSSTMTKCHLLLVFYSIKWLVCSDVPLRHHSLIHSF